MEIKYTKSAARVLNRDCVNKGGLDLFKNVLWVSVQGAEFKVRQIQTCSCTLENSKFSQENF